MGIFCSPEPGGVKSFSIKCKNHPIAGLCLTGKNGIMAIKDLPDAGYMMRPEDGGEPMEKVRRFLNNNIFIFSVRQGLLLTIPFLIMGSFSLVIMNFPVRIWQDYLASGAGSLLDMFLMGI